MTKAAGEAIPRLAGWSLIGSTRALSTDPATFVMEVGRANGGLVEVRSFRRVFVAVTDREFVRHILLTRARSYRRFHGYGRPLLGESLLTVEGEAWRERRRQTGSIFRFEVLDRVMPLVRDETDRALARWDEASRARTPLLLGDEARRLVVLGLTRAMMSGWSSDERQELVASVAEGLRLTTRRNSAVLRFPRALPTLANLRLARAIRDIDGRLQPSVIRRSAGAANDGRDLLDALLSARDPETGEGLTDGEVIAELKGLLATGIDTTALLLTRVLEKLANHPDAANAWHSELERELDGRLPERGDLPRLTRLTQTVNETLRLHPPVPTLSRECIEPDVVGGYAIPRGTRLLLSILAIHRDERYWPEPDAFRPGRFTTDWPRSAFLPFGAGQHGCVANNFAMAHVLMTLAMIGQRFRLTTRAPGGDGTGRREGEGVVLLQPISRG